MFELTKWQIDKMSWHQIFLGKIIACQKNSNHGCLYPGCKPGRSVENKINVLTAKRDSFSLGQVMPYMH